jgi:hypothetical protein
MGRWFRYGEMTEMIETAKVVQTLCQMGYGAVKDDASLVAFEHSQVDPTPIILDRSRPSMARRDVEVLLTKCGVDLPTFYQLYETC